MSISTVADYLEACLHLILSVDSGVLISKDSAIISYSTLDPYQAKSKGFSKAYNCYYAMSSCIISSFSASRNLKLSLVEGDSNQALLWETWNSSRLLKTKSLKKYHSVLANHPCFGKPTWHSNDEYMIYVADTVREKFGNFWSEEEKTGNSNLYIDKLGDELDHLLNPKLFLYDIVNNEIKEIITSDNIYPAQPNFRPGTDEFAYIGYLKEPYRIGIKGLHNRDTKLFKRSVKSEEIEEILIPDKFIAALYPKFSPNGKLLCYYAAPKGIHGHTMCLSLIVYDIETRESKIVLDTVEEFNENFNGIYGFQDKLAQLDWLDNHHIGFTAVHKVSTVIFVTDLNGNLSLLNAPLDHPYNCVILDVYHETILFKASNVKTPDIIYLADFNNETWNLTMLDNTQQQPLTPLEIKVQNTLDSSEIIIIPHKVNPNQSILYKNPNSTDLLISIHGGPHASSYVEHLPSSCLRLSLGFSFVEINYRGSTGFGEKSRKTLLGHIGEVDVEDCIDVIEQAKALINPTKVVIHGKSMGGFLSGHLASRINPDASVILNAATNIAGFALNTDMNEWPFSLALNSEGKYPPSLEEYTQMYKMSPLMYADRIQCPIFLAAGGSDVRVDSKCTMEMYRVLKALGKDVKTFWYKDDGHAFGIKSTSLDLLTNTFAWVLEKIKRTNI